MKIKSFIRNLFCKHKGEVVCWHWSHGCNGNEYIHLEIQCKCTKCGKYYIRYIFDPSKYKEFVDKYKDKQWSNNCNPVLKEIKRRRIKNMKSLFIMFCIR